MTHSSCVIICIISTEVLDKVWEMHGDNRRNFPERQNTKHTTFVYKQLTNNGVLVCVYIFRPQLQQNQTAFDIHPKHKHNLQFLCVLCMLFVLSRFSNCKQKSLLQCSNVYRVSAMAKKNWRTMEKLVFNGFLNTLRKNVVLGRICLLR